MARTTKTPHKVSRNKSGSPIVRASRLFSGRPKRTTRETAFDTEHQAQDFADALNLAAVRDADWRCLLREEVRRTHCAIEDQAKNDGTKEEGVPGPEGGLG
jgi:hypothetical protein